MSDSESEHTSEDEPGYDVSAVQRTPEPKPRSHGSRGRQIIPLSPAWIKQSITSRQKKDAMGLNFKEMKDNTDVVVFSIPAGVKLDDLHGKRIMFPQQAGASSNIDGHRLEVVCGAPETNTDLHLLGVVDGATDSKPVTQVYSLQISLADVPDDEEPVDETILDSLRKALSKDHVDSPEEPPKIRKKKKKKSKKVRASVATGEASAAAELPLIEHEQEPAAAVAPPDTGGHAASADEQDVDGQGKSMMQSGVSVDGAAADADTADEDGNDVSIQKESKKKKKKKKKRSAEVVGDEARDAQAGDAEMGSGYGDEVAEQTLVGVDALREGVQEEAVEEPEGEHEAAENAAEGGDIAGEKPSKPKKHATSAGAALELTALDEAADTKKKTKKKRSRSVGTAEPEAASPKRKKKSKKSV